MAHRNKGFRQEQRDWLKANPFPSHKVNKDGFIGQSFSKFIESLSEAKKKEIFARNESYLEPRQDARFKNINTMHPSKSSKFKN